MMNKKLIDKEREKEKRELTLIFTLTAIGIIVLGILLIIIPPGIGGFQLSLYFGPPLCFILSLAGFCFGVSVNSKTLKMKFAIFVNIFIFGLSCWFFYEFWSFSGLLLALGLT